MAKKQNEDIKMAIRPEQGWHKYLKIYERVKF